MQLDQIDDIIVDSQASYIRETDAAHKVPNANKSTANETPMLEYFSLPPFAIRNIKSDTLFANTLDLQQTTSIVPLMVYTAVYTTYINTHKTAPKKGQKKPPTLR